MLLMMHFRHQKDNVEILVINITHLHAYMKPGQDWSKVHLNCSTLQYRSQTVYNCFCFNCIILCFDYPPYRFMYRVIVLLEAVSYVSKNKCYGNFLTEYDMNSSII